MEFDLRIRLPNGIVGALLAAVVLPALLAQEKTPPKQSLVSVPFVGCPSDGQVGPLEVPNGTTKVVAVSQQDAQRLAYYEAFRNGVLAPRGWHCFGVYGSGGSHLFVVPQSVDTSKVLSIDRDLLGPAIVLSSDDGGTSGRFTVAEMIARVFPAFKALTKRVADEISPDQFPVGSFQGDRLTYTSKSQLEYVTPAQSDGMGTRSWLKKNDRPIAGVALLQWETADHSQMPDLVQLAVRLPRELSGLAPAIIHQVEREVARDAK